MTIKNWKYVKPLNNPNAVEEFEKTHGMIFPVDLKEIIKCYNGGRPELKLYDTATEKDKEFKTLLSFNETDIENIYKYCDVDSSNKTMIPFASDSAGNLFVLKAGKIYLWNHESDTLNFIADKFTDFLNSLHS